MLLVISHVFLMPVVLLLILFHNFNLLIHLLFWFPIFKVLDIGTIVGGIIYLWKIFLILRLLLLVIILIGRVFILLVLIHLLIVERLVHHRLFILPLIFIYLRLT